VATRKRFIPVGGIERARDRARKFGRAHTAPQKPGEVKLVLRDELGVVNVIGSPHPTVVVTKEGSTVAKLAPGEPALFQIGSSGWRRVEGGQEGSQGTSWRPVSPEVVFDPKAFQGAAQGQDDPKTGLRRTLR
jgi:hypothetical protein